MLALLARVDPNRLSVEKGMIPGREQTDNIQIIVSEGLQVTVPMAGESVIP